MAKVRAVWTVLILALLATALAPGSAGASVVEPVSITIENPQADELLYFEVIPSGSVRGATLDAEVSVAMRHNDTGLWLDDHYSLSSSLFFWPMNTSGEISPDGTLDWGYGEVIRIFEGDYTMYAIVRDVNGKARDTQTYSAEWQCFYECGPEATTIDSPVEGDALTHPISANGTWYKWNAAVEPIKGVRVGIRFDDGTFYAGSGERSRQITWFGADVCCPDSTNAGTWSIDNTFKLRPGTYTLIAQAAAEEWQANPAQTTFTVVARPIIERS